MKHPSFDYRILVLIASLLGGLHAIAAPITLDEATTRAETWMENHPLMGKIARKIDQAETYPGAGAPYSVYVMKLLPAGYLLLNSDDSLPLVIAFSENSTLSLQDAGENSFRAFIDQYVQETAEQLAQPPRALAAEEEMVPQSSDELIPPMLETAWNQCHPYNLYAPAAPTAGEYNGYRAPTGCVPTAYAQVLNFHRWPLHGNGSHSYTDNTGSLTGNHSAVFSDPYDWGSMQRSYNAFGANPQTAMNAVGELNYELGVAVQANFEASGTSSITSFLGNQLGKHFYYDKTISYDTPTPYLTALANDLRKGYPSVLTIPGHAVVVDGLLTTGGTTTYHINYGWGGDNNGWWAANSIPNGAANGGVSSIIPSLMAFPVQASATTTAGVPLELQWILPKRRELEASQLTLHKRTLQTQPWTSDASTLGRSTAINWNVVTGGRSGNCWSTGPNTQSVLDLEETFIPTTNTTLTFYRKLLISTGIFRVSISTNDGDSFTPLRSLTNVQVTSWTKEEIPLNTYAGQTIRLRFELIAGNSWYPSGGVWIDDLSMNSGQWNSWTPLVQNLALDSRRFSSVTTVWDPANNFTIFQKTSTDSYKDWVVAALDTGGTGFYKEPGGYSNRQYHLTSYSTITPTANTRLRLHMKYNLASDVFRVMASTNRTTFTQIATMAGTADWGDAVVNLNAYAGQAIYIRLEYVVGGSYTNGGVWIDSISTEQVTNPELEGQPVHFTVTDAIPPGTYVVAATITDQQQTQHRLSPAFTLQVDAPENHQVTFELGELGTHAGGGDLVQTVPHGNAAVAPVVVPDPGWLLNSWDPTFDEITSDLAVVASYQPKLAAHGTPHWWLIEHGFVDAEAPDSAFNAAENSDPLGKGQSLHAEFLFGTDPKDPSSRFETQFTKTPTGQVSVQWTGRVGRIYRVLRTTDLASPWEPISIQSCQQDQLPMSCTDAIMPTGSAFYRIAVSLDN